MSENQKINIALDNYIELERTIERSVFDLWASHCGSPIERIMGAALYWARLYGNRLQPLYPDGKIHDRGAIVYTDVTVTNQCQIGDWRVDFFVRSYDPDMKIIVECDGHEFHERTAEQAERDRSRDRLYQEKGYIVLRFTGREIYRDPVGCAQQVTRLIEDRGIKEHREEINRTTQNINASE
jgi:very-short-patch-repair endonuclease